MAQEEEPADRHQEAASKLRAEIEELVRQAHVLLHGEQAERPAPKAAHPKRAERERELEVALERVDWYRREIKRLRAEELSRDHLGSNGPGDGGRDRDPMELHNRIAERRKELQHVHRVGEGLDRIADTQRRAEAAQNALRPEVKERLRSIKNEVEQQKRLNVQLQSDRSRLSAEQKAAKESVRNLGSDLRSKAAQIRKPPRTASPAAAGREGPPVLKQLRRDLEILMGAVQSDERRFQAGHAEGSHGVEVVAAQVAALRERLQEREAEISRPPRPEEWEAELARPPRPSGHSVRPSPRAASSRSHARDDAAAPARQRSHSPGLPSCPASPT